MAESHSGARLRSAELCNQTSVCQLSSYSRLLPRSGKMDPPFPPSAVQSSSSTRAPPNPTVPLQSPILQHPVLDFPVAAQHVPASMVADTSIQEHPSLAPTAGSSKGSSSFVQPVGRPELQLSERMLLSLRPQSDIGQRLQRPLPHRRPSSRPFRLSVFLSLHDDNADVAQTSAAAPRSAPSPPLEAVKIKLSVPVATRRSSPSDDLTPEPSSDGDAEGSEVDIDGGYGGGALVSRLMTRGTFNKSIVDGHADRLPGISVG